MVKIIDGEIVQDDDPRAIEWERRQRQGQNMNHRSNSAASWQQRQSASPNAMGANAMGAFGRMGMGVGQQAPQGPSPLEGLNEKLSQLGLRPWNIGEHVIEPVFQVALILGLVFFGVQGLIIVGIIWYMFGRTPRQA